MSGVGSLSASPEVPFFNIFDPEFNFNSAEMTAAQDRSWYAASPVGLLVLRYAEAQELLRDRRLDHNGKRYMEQTCGVFSGPAYDWYVPMIVNREGGDHLRLRRLMNKTFTPRMIDDLRPFIRTQADRLADQIASAGECEFVRDFATQLPLAVMCHMLGVPPEDYDTFRVWGTDIGLVFSMALGGDIPARVENAVTGLSGYADSLIEQKKTVPADDLISALVSARQASKVTDAELRNLVVTMVFAAYETTRQQFGNAMAAFAAHPAQWTTLASHPELGEQAANEAIRWCPSATSVARYAAEDFVYHDLPIARYTYLMMCVPTAQRDPRVPRCPALRHHDPPWRAAAPVRRRTALLPRRRAGPGRAQRSAPHTRQKAEDPAHHRPGHLAPPHRRLRTAPAPAQLRINQHPAERGSSASRSGEGPHGQRSRLAECRTQR